MLLDQVMTTEVDQAARLRECCCLTPDRADRRTPDTVAAVQLQMTDWDAFQLRNWLLVVARP